MFLCFKRSFTAQQSRCRNGTSQKFPSTPVCDTKTSVPAAGDTGDLEFHDNIREEKVEKVYPDHKGGRVRRRKLEHNRRSKSRLSEKLRHNISRKKGPNHLEEAKKLLEELEKLRDERLLAEHEENSSRMFLFDNLPFRTIKKNAMIQRKIKQHSLEIQNKIKQMRNIEIPQGDGNSLSSHELQRELLEEKMKKQSELEYRFRAFTGSSRSTKSGSYKTSST